MRRILAICTSHIGGVLQLTPALELLRHFFPEAEVSVLVRKGAEVVLENNPFIKEIYSDGEITSNRRLYKSTRSSLGKRLSQVPSGLRLIRKLRRQHFDLAIDFNGTDRAAILAFFSGARERAGINSPGGFFGKSWLFTELHPPPPDSIHRVLKLAEMVFHVARRHSELATPPPVVGRLVLKPTAENLRWAESQWKEQPATGGPRILIHPTSRVAYKCWAPAKWAKVIGHMLADFDGRVMVTCSPDPGEIKMAEETLALCPQRPVALLGGMTLGRLAALIQQADLFLGVDSAPMHIAAAVGTPLVALFGPSNEKIWGPWGQTEWVVRHPCVCQESRQRLCVEEQGMKCLNDVTVDEFLDKVRARLEADDLKHGTSERMSKSVARMPGLTT